MMTAFPFPTPLVLGHRGASAHAPENTLASFRLALEQGADGIELDARLTRDGEVVVLHDGRVERVSNGQGPVAGLTLAEVQRLDAGSRFSPAFAGERIPALAEVFETLGDRPVYDLEIKNFGMQGNGLERKVLALVRRYGLEKRVIITSFNPDSVHFFRRELPEAPAGLLLLGGAAGRLEEILFMAWTSGNLLGLSHSGLTPALIERHKSRSVFVWGVRTSEDVRRAFELGAAGVIADDPAMVRAAL
jgi:glycerophosphoryl diester phosphodiesterase